MPGDGLTARDGRLPHAAFDQRKARARRPAPPLRQERPQQYRDLMKSITDTSAAKGFMWGSPVCEEFVHRGVGAQYLLFCLLFLYHGKGKDRITEEKVAELWADNELGCVEALNAALVAVPNSRPPVEAGGEDR